METKNNQGLFYGVIGVSTLIITIIGATFAYFSAAGNNEGTIAGNTASGGVITVSVTRIKPSATDTGKIVPLNSVKDNAQDSATSQIADALANSCKDSNQNTVCHVYQVHVANNGSTAIRVYGSLTLNSPNSPNMKWKLITNPTTDNTSSTVNRVSVGKATGDVTAKAGDNLTASDGTANSGTDEKDYYVLVWLEETGTPQDSTDANATFTGSVTFNAVDNGGNNVGGLTATFNGEQQATEQTVYTANLYDENATNNNSVMIGSPVPNNITQYDTEEGAMDALKTAGGGTTNYPFFLKHTTKSDTVTESYVGFKYNGKTYYLRGLDTYDVENNECKSEYDDGNGNCISPYYESNKATLLEVFGSSNCTDYSSYFGCHMSGLHAAAYVRGDVGANDDAGSSCNANSGGFSYCDVIVDNGGKS